MYLPLYILMALLFRALLFTTPIFATVTFAVLKFTTTSFTIPIFATLVFASPIFATLSVYRLIINRQQCLVVFLITTKIYLHYPSISDSTYLASPTYLRAIVPYFPNLSG